MIGKKKVALRLYGQDGNAFNLMVAFKRQARREQWTHDEINTVLDECRSGDYDHLLQTLLSVCEPPHDGDGVD